MIAAASECFQNCSHNDPNLIPDLLKSTREWKTMPKFDLGPEQTSLDLVNTNSSRFGVFPACPPPAHASAKTFLKNWRGAEGGAPLFEKLRLSAWVPGQRKARQTHRVQDRQGLGLDQCLCACPPGNW